MQLLLHLGDRLFQLSNGLKHADQKFLVQQLELPIKDVTVKWLRAIDSLKDVPDEQLQAESEKSS